MTFIGAANVLAASTRDDGVLGQISSVGPSIPLKPRFTGCLAQDCHSTVIRRA